MIDWSAFTLMMYVFARMGGFVLFNPIFARTGVPAFFQAGFALMLTLTVYYAYGGEPAAVPTATLELMLHLLLEVGLGAMVALVMRFFFLIPEQAGEVVDTQMGLSMAKTYDPGAHASLTTTASLLNMLMIMTFFAAGGHHTLLRIMLTSGDIVPFGQASFGEDVAERGVELFVECFLLSVKLSLPILAAELIGQVGMGVVMKFIPQINVFAINIELKVIIGLVMLLLLLQPMSDFLVEAERQMLLEIRQALSLAAG